MSNFKSAREQKKHNKLQKKREKLVGNFGKSFKVVCMWALIFLGACIKNTCLKMYVPTLDVKNEKIKAWEDSMLADVRTGGKVILLCLQIF